MHLQHVVRTCMDFSQKLSGHIHVKFLAHLHTIGGNYVYVHMCIGVSAYVHKGQCTWQTLCVALHSQESMDISCGRKDANSRRDHKVGNQYIQCNQGLADLNCLEVNCATIAQKDERCTPPGMQADACLVSKSLVPQSNQMTARFLPFCRFSQ